MEESEKEKALPSKEKAKPQPVRPEASVKPALLARLQKLEGRSATVGTQLDEIRAILKSIIERLPR